MTAVGRRRRRLDLVLMATGAVMLVTSTLLAKHRVYGWEVAAFRRSTDSPTVSARTFGC